MTSVLVSGFEFYCVLYPYCVLYSCSYNLHGGFLSVSLELRTSCLAANLCRVRKREILAGLLPPATDLPVPARRPLLELEIGATWHKSVSGDLRWIRVVRALVHSHLKVTGRLAPVLHDVHDSRRRRLRQAVGTEERERRGG